MRDPTRFRFLLSFLFLILSYQATSQTNISSKQNSIYNPPTFENITIKEGLPENSGTCILQDYFGYLWISTENGLAQYDGYTMKVFQPEGDNNSSISGEGIANIYEDKNKTLWIATWNGLNKFNRINESFKSYKYNAKDTNSINDNRTHCIYEDKSGRFWVGTGEGLNLFDRKNEIFTRFYFREGDSKPHSTSASDQYNLGINAITEDPVTGDLLMGAERDGLWRFNVKEKIFSKYKFNSENNFDNKIGSIQSFYKASDGKIWMASYNSLSSMDPKKREFKSYLEFPIIANERYNKPNFVNGSVIEDREGLIWSAFMAGEQPVFCLNPKTETFQQYKLFPEKTKETKYNKVFALYEDRSGIIWIGTAGSGLMKFNKRKNQFQILKSDPYNFSNCLSHPEVYSIIYDPKGFIWFCTRRALDKYDIKSGTYKHYLQNEECITQSLYYALQDKSGYIWLGTSSCGLIRVDPSDGSYRFYLNDINKSANLVDKHIMLLFLDHLGILWMGTDGFGLYKYDITNNKVTQYRNDPNDPSSLSQDQVRVIFEDHLGNLWVGTNLGGLNKFDRKTEKFTYCGFTCINIIYEDKQGNLWVADYLSGLNLVDGEKGAVIANYNQKDGLVSDFLLGILEDDYNNLWINAENGLSKFNINTRTIRNYYKEDGLPDWFLTESKCGKGLDGRMYFNTSEGEMVFHPDSIKDDPTPPQVVLSGISLFNRPDEKLKYEGFIPDLEEIILPYDQNDLRFDFVGLHFSVPAGNKYKYFLENFDNDWVNARTQRNATYTNLDPGEYVFRVTASNKDGVWNETGTSIKIIINPPLWATTWAYILYVILTVGFVYYLWKLNVRRIKVKHEFEMSKFETEKLHEVDQMKSRFFANISHEFRTPLTLIIGPTNDIIEKSKDNEIKQSANLIKRSANRLLGLVNQLLDLSKLEGGKMKLETQGMDIIPLLKGLVLSFSSLAERKKITLGFNTTEEKIYLYLDKDKIEKIVNNLLSNAFKFTPVGGKIDFTVTKETNELKLKISDDGKGIAKDHLDKIFDRFYQIDGSQTREQEGTGIGLALTKELVELHKGKIKVESVEGKGTTFIVNIPLGKEHLKPEEIIETVIRDDEFAQIEEVIFETDTKKEKTEIDILTETDKPLLLIVEDNADVRKYIIGHLKSDYRILEAIDGEDGGEQALNHIPDLIISDVMMPRMDGFQFCNKVKSDERTSHIPVILLTAKATSQDKIEGFETGADDYIMKPFEASELLARIKNLIDIRRKLQEKFSKSDFIIKQSGIKINSLDEQFIHKVMSVIEVHLSEEDFTIEEFESELAMSRSQIYRKLKALTGKSPSRLLRSVRLAKAKKMILEHQATISEIAYSMGFASPAYFASCFKEEFGCSPSDISK